LSDQDAQDGAGELDEIKKQLAQAKESLAEARKKRGELEAKIKTDDEKFTKQFQHLLDVEKGLITGEDALHLIERQHIDALAVSLRKENKRRLDAEEKLKKVLAGHDKEVEEIKNHDRAEIEKRNKLIRKLKTKLLETRDKLEYEKNKREEFEERTTKEIAQRVGTGAPKDAENPMQMFINLLGRLGNVNVSEAERTLEIPAEELRDFARVLSERGLVKASDLPDGDLMVNPTPQFVKKINELRAAARRKGISEKEL